MDGSNWRSESFRDNIVAKLTAHIDALDVALKTDARQMEGNIYQKARSEHEYLAYIARLLVYIRDKSRHENPSRAANISEERSDIETNEEPPSALEIGVVPQQLQPVSTGSIPPPPPPPPPSSSSTIIPTTVRPATPTNRNNFSHTNGGGGGDFARRPEPSAQQRADILRTAIATVLQNPAWRVDPASLRPPVQLFGQYVAAQLSRIEDEELLVSTQQQVIALLNKAL